MAPSKRTNVERLRQTPEGRALIAAEIARRKQTPQFTAELFAGAHEKQLAYITSTAQYVSACCSRRAAKTFGNIAILILTSLRAPGVCSIYIGLSERQVRRTAWKTFKQIAAKYKVPATWTEDMVVTFANGSQVFFESLDDERHIETLLGSSLAGGVAILDEIQAAPSALVEHVERVLEPALTDTTADRPTPGRLIWSGTVPDAPVGRFYEIAFGDNPAYERHSWNRFDNPYLTNQRANLTKRLARLGITEDEPFVQREEFGRPNYGDVGRTAYGYEAEKNAYDGIVAPCDVSELEPFRVIATIPPDGVDTFVCGIDPAGKSDRYAIVVWGWGKASNKLYEVFEAVTVKGIDSQTQADRVLVFIAKHYPGTFAYVRDFGSASVLDDSLKLEHGIVVEQAVKAGLKARVDRVRQLLVDGRAKVLRGGLLAEDLSLARWNQDERAKGRWTWASNWHPDVADAANYAIQRYLDYSEDARPSRAQSLMAFIEEQAATFDARETTEYGQAGAALPGSSMDYGGRRLVIPGERKP